MTYSKTYGTYTTFVEPRPKLNNQIQEHHAEEAQRPHTTDKGCSNSCFMSKSFWCWIIAFLTLCAVVFVALTIKDALTAPRGDDGQSPQCRMEENNRFNCWPEVHGATQEKCERRGCCWRPAATPGAPYCYFSSNYGGYTASKVKVTAQGVTADLKRTGWSLFPPDISKLKLQVDFQTETRLRVKIFDPANDRFEAPVKVPPGSAAVIYPEYQVKIDESPFNIVIVRKSTGIPVFDTRQMAPFIFADQFIQIGTALSTPYLYGLGEHRFGFLQEIHTWRKLVFWNRGDFPKVDRNGYGSHPFFLNLEQPTDNRVPHAHGVLLLNSNAGEVALQPYGENQDGAVTFRFIGGVVDLFVLLGQSPLSVAAQYSQMVGPSHMPPYWALGFHLCRYGYNTSQGLSTVIKRNRNASIPCDVQWSDIDYMDHYKDWTYSQENYTDLPNIVSDLHSNKQRYIIMADPAISTTQPYGSYPPFDDGQTLDIFVKNVSKQILIGKVWPGEVAFPDFFHPDSLPYWYKQVKEFHGKLPFDGLWIDMNEPTSFVDGSTRGCFRKSKYNYPPYTPATIEGGSLIAQTICPSAQHWLSTHYDLHNMYGWSMANVTRGALGALYGNRRSPIISRSTFVGSGRYTGHWLGDNESTFKDMASSIAGILNFNLYGIPLVGADICGFRGQTTPELCTRWHQLGVFYPFMRNHADIDSSVQDPASFQFPYVDFIRDALKLRYSLLAVLYTGFYNAHTKGLPIVRPLFYLYPGTEAIDSQFMWNDQLLVSPVLTEEAISVKAVIPKYTFYDFYTGKPVIGQGYIETLDAPLDTIPVHIRAGSILPLLPPTQRTDDSRNEKFKLVVATAPNGIATGELFWDDGESADSIPKKLYTLIEFKVNKNTFTSDVVQAGFSPENGIKASEVMVLGVSHAPNTVLINGHSNQFLYNRHLQTLEIPELYIDLMKHVNITWTFETS